MKCTTAYCRNDAIEGRDTCAKCRSRRYKERHPFRYHYNLLRCNARRRGKHFALAFENFKRLWQESGHWDEKLAEGQCQWQMDRIDVTRGYVPGNIQIITKHRNIMKYVKEGRFRMDVYWDKKHGQQRLELEQAPF